MSEVWYNFKTYKAKNLKLLHIFVDNYVYTWQDCFYLDFFSDFYHWLDMELQKGPENHKSSF